MAGFQLPPLSTYIAELAGYQAAVENRPRVPAQCKNWAMMVTHFTKKNPGTLGVSIPISEAWLKGYQQRCDEEAAEALR